MIRSYFFNSIIGFCFFLLIQPLICKAGYVGDIGSIEKRLQGRDDIVFFGGFEQHYNDNIWKTNWGIPWDNRASQNTVILNGFNNGKSLKVKYPAGGVGPSQSGMQFPIVLNSISNVKAGFFNELYLRYYIKFETNFDFQLGGKLPGLMGGGKSWKRSGGDQPDGSDGWTLRFMWRQGGRIVVYAYVPRSANGKWGGEQWGQNIDCGNFYAIPGTWHCIEQYVNVGTPNMDNGKLKVWIDGVEKLNINDMCFWYVENNNGRIGGVYFSTFHGGNTASWAPDTDSFAQFDGIVLATNKVGLNTKTSINPILSVITQLLLDD